MTFLKGLGIVVGGILLGFFGCAGGLASNSIAMAGVMLALGGGVIVWGVIVMLIAFARLFTGPAPNTEPPPPLPDPPPPPDSFSGGSDEPKA